MTPNYDPVTQCHYGFMNGQKMPALCDCILTHGVDLFYENTKRDTESRLRADLAEVDAGDLSTADMEERRRYFVRLLGNYHAAAIDLIDLASCSFDIDEVVTAVLNALREGWDVDDTPMLYEKDGYKIILSRINGLQLTFEKSPFCTEAKLCSPCCPNAGDLDSTEGGAYATFCPGPELLEKGGWRSANSIDEAALRDDGCRNIIMLPE